jgi:hypothetical protein
MIPSMGIAQFRHGNGVEIATRHEEGTEGERRDLRSKHRFPWVGGGSDEEGGGEAPPSASAYPPLLRRVP